MQSRFLISAIVGIGLVCSSSVVLAHHGDAGRFIETPISLTGTVVSWRLMNPHSIIVLDVEDEQGEVVRWRAELSGPLALVTTFGWAKDTLKPGDRITMTGRRVKSGAPYFNLTEQARIVMTETGEEIFRTEDIFPTEDYSGEPQQP